DLPVPEGNPPDLSVGIVKHRVVRYLAGAGVRQFLDIGTGIPTRPNVHEIAQGIAADSRVVYVDNDPLVLSHARALMVGDPAGRTAYIDADFTRPKQILADSDLRTVLDLDQPVALLMIAVLMLARDSDDPWAAVRTLMDALPSGSYLAITHPGQDFDPAAMDAIVRAATDAGMILVPRDRAGVQRFFGDWELADPGVVPVMAWHPDGEQPEDPNGAYYWAGLARKP
ncbi:SAM-dependent methyltransferase, partial [Actinoplanes sichuanensis]